MKFTNETLKQQPSEDFTNINEDEPYAYIGRLSTAFEQYERENNDKMNDFEKSKKELQEGGLSDQSSTSKVVKISCLSLLKPSTTSNASLKYSSGSMSPGAKFKQNPISKISPEHVNEFLIYKNKNSNSWEKIDNKFKRSLFNVKSHQKSKYEDKENTPIINIQDNLQRTPNVIEFKLQKLHNYNDNSEQKQYIITPAKSTFSKPEIKIEHNSSEKSMGFETDGSENVKERISDAYASKNESRIPRTSDFWDKIISLSGRFQDDHYKSVWETYHIKNTDSISTTGFGSFITNRGGKRSQFDKFDPLHRSYCTETGKDKRNFDNQMSCNSFYKSNYSLNFGPKATNSVSDFFCYLYRNLVRNSLVFHPKKSKNTAESHVQPLKDLWDKHDTTHRRTVEWIKKLLSNKNSG